MDAEGGGHHVHRERRISARMLAVVLAVQNALVAACLLVTLYVFWIVLNQDTENVHIQFGSISGVLRNETLQFGHTESKNLMSLADGKEGKIIINCTGPYVLHIDLCYNSLDLEKGHLNTTGTLQLQVEGTPRSSFQLQASHLEVCRGLHSIAFLRAKEQASLHLYSDRPVMMKKLTAGLSYLLGTGAQCDF